jgi:hypothetical protein
MGCPKSADLGHGSLSLVPSVFFEKSPRLGFIEIPQKGGFLSPNLKFTFFVL